MRKFKDPGQTEPQVDESCVYLPLGGIFLEKIINQSANGKNPGSERDVMVLIKCQRERRDVGSSECKLFVVCLPKQVDANLSLCARKAAFLQLSP